MSHRPNSLVPEHPRSALGTAGLRGIDWARPPAATLRVTRPPGRELKGSLSVRLVLTRGGRPQGPITNQRKELNNNLATPPQPHVRKKLESRLARDNRLRFEWIALGFTAQSFWTGTRRWIVSLESKLRLGLTTRLRLTRSSSYRCLAGRPSVRAVKRN
jgi:hypothetical protein